jgi:G3E family GTPase
MSETSHGLGTLLVCGFLGAGKTTFIMEHIKTTGGRTAVLVNEFSDLGVDGQLIQSKNGVHVIEVPGGCICCGQQKDLTENIRKIAEHVRPDMLLIEPSGIAQASGVIMALEDEALAGLVRLDAVIAVIDASTFLEFSEPDFFGTFFLDQVTNADLIVVNKIDMVSPAEREQVSRRVSVLNPSALSVETTFCQIESPLPSGRNRKVLALGNFSLGMECFSMVPGQPNSKERLDQFASAVTKGDFGRVFRAKGIVESPDGEWINLQIVGENVSVTPFHEEARSRITLIGFDLDRTQIRRFVG